jgi:hypothetical protein
MLATAIHFNFFKGSPWEKSDYIGQSWFPEGDSIEITMAVRSQDRLVVEGHYNLVSADSAMLALYIASTNASTNSYGPVDPLQRMRISKGRGDFKLIHPHLAAGLPHVSMYGDGGSFAALYFGSKSESLEESKREMQQSAPLAESTRGFWYLVETNRNKVPMAPAQPPAIPPMSIAMAMLKSGIDRVMVDAETAVIEGRATTGEDFIFQIPDDGMYRDGGIGDRFQWKENTRFTNIIEVRGSSLHYRVLNQAGQDVVEAPEVPGGPSTGPVDFDLRRGSMAFQTGPFRFCDAETTEWGTNATVRIGTYHSNSVEAPVFVILQPDVERRSDNTNFPFVADPAVLGDWQAVDFVDKPADFDPGHLSGRWLWIRSVRFDKSGQGDAPMCGPGSYKIFQWTKGLVFWTEWVNNSLGNLASHYEIRDVEGKTYLFLEWKNDDYRVFGTKPKYYVLEKIQSGSQNKTASQSNNQASATLEQQLFPDTREEALKAQNPEVLRIQLRQAEAEAERLKKLSDAALVPKSELDAAQDKVEILKAELDGDEVRVAQVRLAAAQRDMRRVSELAKTGLVPGSEAAAAKMEVEVREAELKAAQAAAGRGTNSAW